MTPGVPGIGRRVGWPATELAAIDAALARGASKAVIRALVQRLEEQRDRDLQLDAASLHAPLQEHRQSLVVKSELLSREEARATIEVGEAKFRELERRPGFPKAVQLGPRSRRYVRTELLAWAMAQRETLASVEVAR